MSDADDAWREEMRAAFLYGVMAAREAHPERRRLFAELGREAERQAAIWIEGRTPPAYAPDLRTRVVAALVRALGPRAMRGALAAMKVRGLSVYAHGAPAVGTTHAMPRDVSEVGARHRGTFAQGNLRAAVFGVSDGLVSNASLILGVAGAMPDERSVLVAGASGLLAGAFSMAAGEYVSVRSQRELYEYQIGLEREELARYPKEEAAELALIYRAKGLSARQASELATALLANPETALDTLAREELGLNPDELGSPAGAAVASFAAFAAGAALPLAPYALGLGSQALAAAVGVTALALFVVGAATSLFSGRGALAGGLRMLAIGGLAGGVTHAVGLLAGSVLPLSAP